MSWQQIGSDIDGEAEDANSGTSVSLFSDGSVVAIGSWRITSLPGVFDSGVHVRVYKNVNNTWTQVGLDLESKGKEKSYSTLN